MEIGDGAEIGDGTEIGDGAESGDGMESGDGTEIGDGLETMAGDGGLSHHGYLLVFTFRFSLASNIRIEKK